MQQVTKRARQTSAVASLRMLNSMEGEYNSNYPDRGFACSLGALGGEPGSGAPTAEAAQLIPSDLASGTKAGYVFTISGCTKTSVHNKEMVTGYQITAVPTVLHHTGDYGFCTDENAQIRFDPRGGTNCTELLQ
jgi:type IV pilus assembly protein PilA